MIGSGLARLGDLSRAISLVGLFYPSLPDIFTTDFLATALQQVTEGLAIAFGAVSLDLNDVQSFWLTFASLTLPLYLRSWSDFRVFSAESLARALGIVCTGGLSVLIIAAGLDGSEKGQANDLSPLTLYATCMAIGGGAMMFAQRSFCWTISLAAAIIGVALVAEKTLSLWTIA